MPITFVENDTEEEREQDGKVLEIGGHVFERRDPYGFLWCVDPIAKEFDGAFTTPDEATKAVKLYNQRLDAEVRRVAAEEKAKAEAERREAAHRAEVSKRLAERKTKDVAPTA